MGDDNMRKILIVDDAAFIRISLRKMLEDNGFQVVGEAMNGFEAIQKAKELKPDLITMDITMPELDGIEAVKIIMEHNPQNIICMVSAMGQEEQVRDAIFAGAKSFLVKPFKEEKVIKTLKTLLKG